jgi:hypothetical protein
VTQVAKKPDDTYKREAASFRAMTPAQHLENAKLAMTRGVMVEAAANLRAIPDTASEAVEAKLLKEGIAEAALPPLKRAMARTKLTKFNWRKDGFGSVMIADFTVRNDSPYDVKDIEIQCKHSAPSGTVIDQNTRTVYQIVKANSARTFRGVNMGFINSQAEQSRCSILTLDVN